MKQPANPGPHTAEARDATRVVKLDLTLAEGQKLKSTLDFANSTALPVEAAPVVVAPPVAAAAPVAAAPPPAAAQAPVPAPASDTGARSVPVGVWVGVAVAGAGLVTGGVTAVLAAKKKGDLNCPSSGCLPSQGSDVDSYNQLRTISTIGFIAAGVGVATAGAFWFTRPREAERTGYVLRTNMKTRNAALLLTLAFLLASCFLPKLKVDESATGGSGGSDVPGAGKSSGTAAKASGGAGKGSGGANNNSGEAGSGNGDAGTPEPGTGGAQPGAGAGGASGGAPGGGAPSGGAPGGGAPGGGAPGAGAGGALNMAGAPAGGAAGAPGNPLLAVKATAGCGKDPVLMLPGGVTVPLTPGTPSAKITIMTSGTKAAGCADSACGAWTYPRDFYVTLPTPYDKTKAYPLVLEGPGCGGAGTDVYPLTNPSANANNTVIRVGLTPPPNTIGHATNPNQGCFDDKEGTTPSTSSSTRTCGICSRLNSATTTIGSSPPATVVVGI